MSRTTFLSILFVCIFFQGTSSAIEPASVSQIITQEIATLRADDHYEAVSGAVYFEGQEYSFHFGQLENGQKPNDNTLFEIGSLTKTYTGLLLAQAVADGKVDLDTPVTHYLKGFAADHFRKDGKDATIRDLATHTSGIPVNIACNDPSLDVTSKYDCYKNYDRPVFFEALQQTKLLDRPGEGYRYSNAGIRLLSHIIEDAYALSYPELLASHVFSRSGEKDTLFRLGDGDLERLAVGLDAEGNLMPSASEQYFGAGALKTTTTSFLKHMKFYLKSSNPLVARATTVLVGDPDGLGRAYVWNTFRYKTEGMLYHAGGTFGTSSWVALYPREKMGVFLVTPLSSPTAQQELNTVSNKIVVRLRQLQIKQ